MTDASVDMKKISTDPRMIVLRHAFKQAAANLDFSTAPQTERDRHQSCMKNPHYRDLYEEFGRVVDQRAQDLRVIDASSPNGIVAAIRKIQYRLKNKTAREFINAAPENLAEMAFGY